MTRLTTRNYRKKTAASATAVCAAVALSLHGPAALAADGTAAAPPAKAPSNADQSLTWHGITLSGIVDVGLQYESHGAPISDYFPAGSNAIIQSDSVNSVTGITPSNLSQSNIALSGKEPLVGDFSAVFKLQTFFNPQSGQLSDGIKSVVLNNGKPAYTTVNGVAVANGTTQTTGIDSSVAGQLFAGGAYAGISAPEFGSLTFGRQTTLAADGIGKYDPNAASNAFSLLGLSGTPAGGGDTEDRRFDNALKYTGKFGPLHVGGMYKFATGGSGSVGSGYQFQVGAEVSGLSIDAVYHKYYDAISVSSLSAKQVASLPGLNVTPTGSTALPVCPGCTIGNTVAATISDNSAWFLMASYDIGPVKVSGGYEDITYANPTTALLAGTSTIGGYMLGFVTNNKFTTNKQLDVYWLGAKWKVSGDLDLTAAYYGENQHSYVTGTTGTCSTSAHGNCSGTFTGLAIDGVYHFSRRFDGYLGAMYSSVNNGLAAGYAYTSTIDPTLGVRFRF